MSSQTDSDTNDLFRFLKDEGTKQVKWTYVGEGKGNFTPMMVNYNYVGHGRGTFDKQAGEGMPANAPPCSKEKIYVVLGLLLFILTVLALFSMPSITKGVQQVIAEQEASRAYDCHVEKELADTWSDEQKQWCCDHHGKACPDDETGCGTLCDYLGKKATCRYRIKWGAEHRFVHRDDACAAAYRMVQEQCDSCHKCKLDDAGCKPG